MGAPKPNSSLGNQKLSPAPSTRQITGQNLQKTTLRPVSMAHSRRSIPDLMDSRSLHQREKNSARETTKNSPYTTRKSVNITRIQNHSDTLEYKKRISGFFNPSDIENKTGLENNPKNRFKERRKSSFILNMENANENLKSKHLISLQLDDENFGYYSLNNKVKNLIKIHSETLPSSSPKKNGGKILGRRRHECQSHLKQNLVRQEVSDGKEKTGLLTKYGADFRDGKSLLKNQKTEKTGRYLNETQLSQLNYQNYQIQKEDSFYRTLRVEKSRILSETKLDIDPVVVGNKKIDIMKIFEEVIKNQPMVQSLNNFFSVWTLFSQ